MTLINNVFDTGSSEKRGSKGKRDNKNESEELTLEKVLIQRVKYAQRK